MNPLTTPRARSQFIDVIRGIAVVLMIFFHLSWDLSAFSLIPPIQFVEDPFWYWLPRLIVFLFLFCSGLSLQEARLAGVNLKSQLTRLGKIALIAVGISITTYILFPQNWIYFGVLHCLSVSALLSLPLLTRPRLALLISIVILTSNLIWKYHAESTSFFDLGLILNVTSMDYEPLYPWAAVMFLAIGLHPLNWVQNILAAPLPSFFRYLSLLGRHSLLIYLLHQPILYGLLWTIT